MSKLEQKSGAKALYTSPFPRWPWCTTVLPAIGIDSEIVLIALVHCTAAFMFHHQTMLELRCNGVLRIVLAPRGHGRCFSGPLIDQRFHGCIRSGCCCVCEALHM